MNETPTHPLLYDYNQSKPLYPYWKFDTFNFDSWNEAECETELRFKKNDLASLMDYLQIPEALGKVLSVVVWKDY